MRSSIASSIACISAFVVYWLTLCPTVYVEGSGELIGAVWGLGTPHPTGYPLFCLSARLFCQILPFDRPAYEVNLAAAFFASAACGALAWLLLKRGVHIWVGLATALVFAFSRTFWSQAVISEVYGQALLLVVLVMAWTLRVCESNERRDLLMLGWLMGLGLTAHLMQMLVWPGVVALLLWRWPGLLGQPRLWLLSVLGALGGYSLVAYLPVRNGLGNGFHWDPIPDLQTCWQHVSGALYRSSFFSLPLEGMALNAERWLRQVAGEFHPLLLPLLVWGGYIAWRRDREMWVLTSCAIGCNLIAALNYHRDPNGLPVFFLLSLVCLTLWLGMGFNDLVGRLGRYNRPALVAALAALAVGAVLTSNYAESDRSQNWIADRYGRDIFADLPEGAVLISEGDDAAFILDYLHRVEQLRPDIALYNRVGRGLDLLAWDEHGLAPRERDMLRLRREGELARSGRPLFYLIARRSPLKGWGFTPQGLLYRLRPDTAVVAKEAIEIEMANAMTGDIFRDAWVRKIQSNYWYMAGEQRLQAGDSTGAIAAYERAATVALDSRSTRFNVAIKLYRSNRFDEAWTHARAAANIDPWKAEPYRLMAHIRRKQGRDTEARILLKRADRLRREP